YLTHVPILRLAGKILPLGYSWPPILPRFFVGLPVTVGLGFLFFLGVGRHFLGRRPEPAGRALQTATDAQQQCPRRAHAPPGTSASGGRCELVCGEGRGKELGRAGRDGARAAAARRPSGDGDRAPQRLAGGGPARAVALPRAAVLPGLARREGALQADGAG